MLLLCCVLAGCSQAATLTGSDGGIRPDLRELCLQVVREMDAYVFDKAELRRATVQEKLDKLQELAEPDEFVASTASLTYEEEQLIANTMSMTYAAVEERWDSFFASYAELNTTLGLDLGRQWVHDEDKISDSILYETGVKDWYHRGSLNHTVGESQAAIRLVEELRATEPVEVLEVVPSRDDVRRVKVTYRESDAKPGDEYIVIMEWLPRDVYEYEIVEMVQSGASALEPEPEPEVSYVTVVSSEAKVWEQSNEDSAVVAVVYMGDKIEWTGRVSQEVMSGRRWYVVKLDDGETGYMDGQDIVEE